LEGNIEGTRKKRLLDDLKKKEDTGTRNMYLYITLSEELILEDAWNLS